MRASLSCLVVPLIVSTIFPVVTSATASAQTWTQRSPASLPLARRAHAMAYDLGRQRAVMFGGRDATQSDLGDTWEWDGVTWKNVTPAASPPARWYHAMTYDLVRRRVVLFGGGAGTATRFNDTWEWDGTNWTQRNPAASPPGRYRHVLEYDIQRQRTVLFAGTTGLGSPGILNDTWEWDGTNWTQLSPLRSPPARISATLTYDLARGKTLLYAGYDGTTTGVFSDTWQWDGVNWTQLAPITVPIERFSQSAAYDRVRQRIVIFGGRNYRTPTDLGDTWEWDGSDWLYTSPPTSPSPRYLTAMVYDFARQQTVMFGGTPNLDETWIYEARGSYGTFGQGCSGSVGLPALQRDLPPVINQPFRILLANLPPNQPGIVFTGVTRTSWSGIPLPLDLTPVGMPGCHLYTGGSVVIAVGSGATGATTFGLTLPNDPALVGGSFYNQAFFVDPPANITGVIATNAGLGVIGS